mmetsp:Transcript_61275/g.145887  ORF Transcript_61275/g.145887 Transcript_61275/m.145887 type:complete len:475 (-) Transcript_61275:91-1515(-)
MTRRAAVAIALAFLVAGSGAVRPSSEDEISMAAQTAELMRANSSSPPSGTFMFMSHDDSLWFSIYEEGVLSEAGEANTISALKFLKDTNPEKFKFLRALDAIWVAPTRAAIQTAIMVIGETRRLLGEDAPFPEIVIKGALRPFGPPGTRSAFKLKQKGMSESVRSFAERYGREFFVYPEKFQEVVQSFVGSYEMKKGNDFGSSTPRNAQAILRHVSNLKTDLFRLPQTMDATDQKVLMIADREFGNYMFASALPWSKPRGTEFGGKQFVPEELMRTLVREEVHSLSTCAFVMADWAVASVSDESAAGMTTSIYAIGKYTNPYFTSVKLDLADLDNHVTRSVPLEDSSESIVEVNTLLPGQLWAPPSAAWSSMLTKKRKRLTGRWSGWKDRMVSFAHWPSELTSDEIGFIGWANEWGDEALGFVSAETVSFSQVGQDGTVTLQSGKDQWQLSGPVSTIGDFITTVQTEMKKKHAV